MMLIPNKPEGESDDDHAFIHEMLRLYCADRKATINFYRLTAGGWACDFLGQVKNDNVFHGDGATRREALEEVVAQVVANRLET